MHAWEKGNVQLTYIQHLKHAFQPTVGTLERCPFSMEEAALSCLTTLTLSSESPEFSTPYPLQLWTCRIYDHIMHNRVETLWTAMLFTNQQRRSCTAAIAKHHSRRQLNVLTYLQALAQPLLLQTMFPCLDTLNPTIHLTQFEYYCHSAI